MAIRLFVDALLSHPGLIIQLSSTQQHYLKNVMRLRPGDGVRIFNGNAGEWEASYQKDTLQLIRQVQAQPLRQGHRFLFFSMIKPARMDWLVEKATEIGASHLVPCLSDRTTTRRCNLERFHRIAVEASEQSGRLEVPLLMEPAPLFDQLNSSLLSNTRGFVMVPPNSVKQPVPPFSTCFPVVLDGCSRDLGVLIGPEGGWSPQELTLFQKNPSLTLVSLGHHILRAETAGVVALGMLQQMA